MKRPILHVKATQEGQLFVCERCGKEYRVNLPIPISMYAVLAKEFVKIHRHCKAAK